MKYFTFLEHHFEILLIVPTKQFPKVFQGLSSCNLRSVFGNPGLKEPPLSASEPENPLRRWGLKMQGEREPGHWKVPQTKDCVQNTGVSTAAVVL